MPDFRFKILIKTAIFVLFAGKQTEATNKFLKLDCTIKRKILLHPSI